jgi:hypothetical protein
MDATRQRRVKGVARQHWYAHWRQVRFAHHMGFVVKIEISEVLVIGHRAGNSDGVDWPLRSA